MWLAVDPVDMRADADHLIARVVQVFGAAQAHHGYLFANACGTRMKRVVHDGFGVRCATRLNQGRFVWSNGGVPMQPLRSRGRSSTPSWWACRGSGSSTCRPSRACERAAPCAGPAARQR